MRGSKVFDDLQRQFEKDAPHLPYMSGRASVDTRGKRLEDGTWPPYFYENGAVDAIFRAYMHGFQFGRTYEADQ